jgi:hypothetical protein
MDNGQFTMDSEDNAINPKNDMGKNVEYQPHQF